MFIVITYFYGFFLFRIILLFIYLFASNFNFMYLFIYSLMKYCHFGISVCVWFSLSVIHSLFTGLINSSVHSGVFVLFFQSYNIYI